MNFKNIAFFQGQAIQELWERIPNEPWIYCIVSLSQKFIYIGETQSQMSILQRLSEHFVFPESSLRKNLRSLLFQKSIKGPLAVYGYSLVFPSKNFVVTTQLDFSNQKLRQGLEANLHHWIAKEMKSDFTILSNCAYERGAFLKEVENIAREIGKHFLEKLHENLDLLEKSGIEISLMKMS